MQSIDPQKIVTWDEPIEMLYACHGNVKRFCKQLRLLPDYLTKYGCNQAVKNDVIQIITYFNRAAPLHHEDEELDFFPALVAIYPQAQHTIDELEKQHPYLHTCWAALAEKLNELIEQDKTEIDAMLIERFVSAYDRHITLEEPLFEQGKNIISQTVLGEIGKKMAMRRQPL